VPIDKGNLEIRKTFGIDTRLNFPHLVLCRPKDGKYAVFDSGVKDFDTINNWINDYESVHKKKEYKVMPK